MLPLLLAACLSQPAQPTPQARTLAFLGDSLTAGYGLETTQAFPSLVGERLRSRNLPWKVVNAGVSGDTSAGGLRRLDWLFRQRVDLLFVCLGANDGLRGIPVEATEQNLRAIIARARQGGARVALAGMRLPENYGRDYQGKFEAMYRRLAKTEKVPLLPFLLEGVAMQPSLNQADGIHPNAEGARRVADRVWTFLDPLLKAQ